MRTRHRISMSAALVVFGGGAYLATPAKAEPVQSCPLDSWYAAAKRANDACQGPASFAGYCDSNGNFVITSISCTSPY